MLNHRWLTILLVMLTVLISGCEKPTGTEHSQAEESTSQQNVLMTKVEEETENLLSPETESVVYLELNTRNLSMLVGEETDLHCTVHANIEGDYPVAWTSDNPSVAEADRGKVRALSPGEAMITASAGGEQVTCMVTVSFPQLQALSLNTESLQLKVGETAKITCIPQPERAVLPSLTWSTSNAAVASCSGGVISAVGAGTAEIMATTREGIYAVCTVTVQSDVIDAQSVTVSRNELNMTVGDIYELYAEIQPVGTTNKTLRWASSAPEIAEVDRTGRVIALAAGTAEISVTTANGKQAICRVEIQPRESIVLTEREITLKVGEYWQLTAETEPLSAKITWISADETVVICTEGLLEAKNVGQTEVTAVLPGGAQAICRITVESAEPVIQVSMDVEVLMLRVGDVYTFTATVEPWPYPLHWDTDHSEVIRILDQNGSISAIAPGEAMVKATVSEKDYAVCLVKVVEEEPDSEYLYSINHAGAVITAYLGDEENLVIPETIDDYPVVGIGEEAFYNTAVTSVILPNTLTYIDDYAFAECLFLQEVILSENLREIGDYAFMNCALKRIVLPLSLRKIGICTFGGCSAMTHIVVPEGSGSFMAENGILYDREQTVLYCVPAGWKGELILADSVREIAPYALYNCGKVSAVRMDAVEILGSGAFASCTALNNMIIPAGVREIPDAFIGCRQLSEVTVPAEVEHIADNAFAGCSETLVLWVEEGSYAAEYAAQKDYLP